MSRICGSSPRVGKRPDPIGADGSSLIDGPFRDKSGAPMGWIPAPCGWISSDPFQAFCTVQEDVSALIALIAYNGDRTVRMELSCRFRMAHRNESEELTGFTEAETSALWTSDTGRMGPAISLILHCLDTSSPILHNLCDLRWRKAGPPLVTPFELW